MLDVKAPLTLVLLLNYAVSACLKIIALSTFPMGREKQKKLARKKCRNFFSF